MIRDYKNKLLKRELAPSTINKKISALSAVLRFGLINGYYDGLSYSLPTTGLRVVRKSVKSKRLPFTIDDLKIIFSSPIYTEGSRPLGGKGEASKWIPLIALYTGMRLGEITQLKTTDIKQDGEIYYFDIHGQEDSKLKNLSSIRKVPIAPHIIKLGLLKYRDSLPTGQLFPLLAKDKNGQYSQAYSKWFNRYIRTLGIRSTLKVFHSFRHTFKDSLRDSGVGKDLQEALLGHSGSSVGDSYGLGYGLVRLKEAVERVVFEM